MGGKLWDYTDGVTKTEKKKESWIAEKKPRRV